MNITEANATMRVLQFLKGDFDHCDEITRAEVARDLLWLQTRAHATLGAGVHLTEDQWDDALLLVTFEGVSA